MSTYVNQDSVSGKLDQSVFPYLRDSPFSSDSNAAPGPAATGPTARPGQRVMPLGKPAADVTSKCETELAQGVSSWRWRRRRGQQLWCDEERLLVFVAGGMTHSEMRTAYETSSALNRDVYIGMSHAFFSFPSFYPRDLTNAHAGSTHITRAGGQLSASGGIARGGFIDDLKMLQSGGPDSSALPGGLKGRQVLRGGFRNSTMRSISRRSLLLLPLVGLGRGVGAGSCSAGIDRKRWGTRRGNKTTYEHAAASASDAVGLAFVDTQWGIRRLGEEVEEVLQIGDSVGLLCPPRGFFSFDSKCRTLYNTSMYKYFSLLKDRNNRS